MKPRLLPLFLLPLAGCRAPETAADASAASTPPKTPEIRYYEIAEA